MGAPGASAAPPSASAAPLAREGRGGRDRWLTPPANFPSALPGRRSLGEPEAHQKLAGGVSHRNLVRKRLAPAGAAGYVRVGLVRRRVHWPGRAEGNLAGGVSHRNLVRKRLAPAGAAGYVRVGLVRRRVHWPGRAEGNLAGGVSHRNLVRKRLAPAGAAEAGIADYASASRRICSRPSRPG